MNVRRGTSRGVSLPSGGLLNPAMEIELEAQPIVGASVSTAVRIDLSTNIWHTFRAASPHGAMARGDLAARWTQLRSTAARLLALSLTGLHIESVNAARAPVRRTFMF